MAEPIAKTQPKTSIITLRMYVDLLRRISNGEIAKLDLLEGSEQRATKELIRSGMVSDDAREVFRGRAIVKGTLAITPEGIAALEEWSAFIKESSFASKAGDVLLRFLWVMVGAIAASMSELFKSVFT